MTDLMDERLSDAARRWQQAQPPPPVVPLDRLDDPFPRRPRWRAIAVASTAAVVVIGGGAVALTRGQGDSTAPPPTSSPTTHAHHARPPVPWRNLPAGHPDVRHREHGHVVTPFDRVSATGHISGKARAGDTLRFTVTLESSTALPLDPCPDFNIGFGRKYWHTWQLNCAQVPFRDSQGRPVLPALKKVRFAMRVTVPDEHGEQKVLWTLDGPQQMPGFYGLVHVTSSR
jgi:hypothetical protein